MSGNNFSFREAWLTEGIRCFEAWFRDRGHELPEGMRVTCGFPSGRALNGSKSQCIGQCWNATASKDQTIEIMVSPVLDEPLRVLGVLAHELIHAAVGPEVGHKGAFRRLATALGLIGKMTATQEGPAFLELVAPILEHLGPYPHAALDARGRKKQTTRLIKAECPECGYTVRVTTKWLDIGPPRCAVEEHGPMMVEE